MKDAMMDLTMRLLAILIPLLVGLAAEYLRRLLGTERVKRIQAELIAKQDLAFLAVRFAEQAFMDLKGRAKYEEAARWLAARAAEHGLKLSADEIEGLVEAALRMIKDELGEQWANAATD